MPGKRRSPAYRPCPETFSTPSMRRTLVPMTVIVFQTPSSCLPVSIDNRVLISLTSSIINNHLPGRNETMAEHIKLTAQEAKQKAEAIRKIILDTYHNEVKPSPFFSELRAGTLSCVPGSTFRSQSVTPSTWKKKSLALSRKTFVRACRSTGSQPKT